MYKSSLTRNSKQSNATISLGLREGSTIRTLTTSRKRVWVGITLFASLMLVSSLVTHLIRRAQADSTAQSLPFSQNWTNTSLISANDNWSGVPGIVGYRGDDLTTATGTDPRTILADGTTTPVNVIANQTAPNTLTTGGVAEFEIANPSIALNGSGTADAPFILINLNTTANSNITVAYNVRDLDASSDNAVQPVNMQYRVGNLGNFVNVTGGYVADATSGPSVATLVTPVSASLPADANNQPLVQVRVMTTNAVGNDEWVGIDDISVTASDIAVPTNPTGTGNASPNSVVAGNSTLLTVSVTPGTNPTSNGLAVSADLSTIGGNSPQTFYDNGTNGDVTPNDNIFSFVATIPFNNTPGAKSLPFTITDAESRSGSGAISLTVQAPPPPVDHVVVSQIYGGGGNSSATYKNDYIELYNPTSSTTFNLTGWSIQYASSAGSGWASQLVPLAGPIAPGEYYLIKLGSGGSVGNDLPAANVDGSSVINMSATTGKIALVNNSDGITGASATCPTDDPNLVDLVGWGSANCKEGSANAPGGSNTTAIFRKGAGAIDTNQNGDDFETGVPNPRRTAIILDVAPSVSATDTDSDPGAFTPAPRDASVAVFFSEDVDVTGTWYDITCANTGAHTAIATAGPKNWVITPDVNFEPGEQCTFTIFASQVRDSDLDDSQPNTDFMQADYQTTFTVATGAAPLEPASVHLIMGNPSGAITDTNQPNNYLIEQPEYSLSYNRDRGGPNWVSWHLSDEWTGSLTRIDTFRPDPKLPSSWYRVNQFDYTGSGFDRGHMTPSADRLETLPINQATFLMDNIVPQSPDNNQGPWEELESYLRTLVPTNEIYIISGPAGVGGTGSNGFKTTIANGNVTVPESTWKVALVLPKDNGDDISRVDCRARTIAVIMPNIQGIRNDPWENYLKKVDEVEALTGYDFFSNLPVGIQRCIEAGVNGTNPPGTADQSATTAEDTPATLTLRGIQANNNTLSFTITGGPSSGSLGTIGSTSCSNGICTADVTYSPNGNYNGSDSFTFKVNDGTNDSGESTFTLTINAVNDTPTADAQSVSTGGNTPVNITLTGSDVETPAGNLTFTVTSGPSVGTLSGTAPNLTYTPATNACGPDSFKFTVTDTGDGSSAALTSSEATVSITVNDTIAPTITLTTGALTLSPPNHTYRTFSISNLVASASDYCDSGVDISDVVITKVTSDELEDAPGSDDGSTLNDIVIAPDCKSVQLRAERNGTLNGRVYTITLKVADSANNVTTATRQVTVPISPGVGAAIDSGPKYTVNSSCP